MTVSAAAETRWRRLLGWIVLLLLLALTGLADAATEGAEELPPEADTYRLAPGDRVRVTVYGHEDLSGEFEVNGAGRVSLPLIREVAAAGLSPRQLAESITDRLQPDYLRNPLVSVDVLTYRPLYVMGEVQTPGSYPWASGMTVINAVAVAGGFTYRARKNRIRIRRDGEAGQETVIRGGPDTPVLPGDVIEVPERFF